MVDANMQHAVCVIIVSLTFSFLQTVIWKRRSLSHDYCDRCEYWQNVDTMTMRTVEGRHCIVPTQECLRSDGGWRLDPRPASAASSGEAEPRNLLSIGPRRPLPPVIKTISSAHCLHCPLHKTARTQNMSPKCNHHKQKKMIPNK